MRILSTFLMTLFIVMGVHAKQVTGIVSDMSRKQPLSGVLVTNMPRGTHTVTDRDGKYTIKAEVGDELRFSYLNYVEQVVKVGESRQLDISLDPMVREDSVDRQETRVLTSAAVVNMQPLVGVHKGSDRGLFLPQMVRGMGYRNSQTESYASIAENKFANPLQEPLSTFAADVDVASYSNVKRFIKSGTLPPTDAVRVEEMINYFDYDLAEPRKGEPVRIMTELAYAPWNTQHQLLRISLKAKDIPTAKLPASNFVFLIDISGSMAAPNKLPLVKSSFKMLVDQLRPQDKIAIVTYAGNANIALESTNGDKKMRIKEVIDGLYASGNTAGGDGLKMAYNIARQNFMDGGNNRVIMATDGDFNVGASSDMDMEKLIVQERESNVNISVLGYGMGNYKDSKLETLANKGRGNYAYINDISEARKAIVSEFGGTMFTVARDVKVQVEFNPKYVQAYRLLGYENRLMAAEDFSNDSKVGGDMGVGHSVTALYEIVPVGVKSTIIGSVDPLKYQDNKNKTVQNSSMELATVKFRYKEPDSDRSQVQEHVVANAAASLTQASEDFRFISAVAELGMLLRQSEYKQQADFHQLIQRAKASRGKDDEGYRAEFIRLAEDAKALSDSERVVRN